MANIRRATSLLRAGHWPGGGVATVTLTFDDRHRRRIRLTDDTGQAFLLDLANAERLADGDALVLEDGDHIRVAAASEAVADVTCDSPAHSARIAWHIGNRHTPVQVLDDATLRIADDHVLVAMVEGLGASVVRHNAAFSPEPGAYADQGGHRSGPHHHEH